MTPWAHVRAKNVLNSKLFYLFHLMRMDEFCSSQFCETIFWKSNLGLSSLHMSYKNTNISMPYIYDFKISSKWIAPLVLCIPESMAFDVDWNHHNKHVEVVSYYHCWENGVSLRMFGSFLVALVNSQHHYPNKRSLQCAQCELFLSF